MLEAIENPAIDEGWIGGTRFRASWTCRSTSLRIREIIKIAEQDPQRVANSAIGVAQPREHFLGERNVVCVIDAAHPQPNQIGAMFLDEMIGVHRLVVGARLRNLLSVNVDHETVGDDTSCKARDRSARCSS